MKYISFFLIILFVGCGPKIPIIGTHPTPPRDSLIERSAFQIPSWIYDIPKNSFLGQGEGKNEKEAKESAISDMLKRYAQYLGIDFKVLTIIHQEEIKRIQEEIHKTERRVVDSVEALSKIITTGSEIRKIYWEKYAKMTGDNIDYYYYKYWVLGEVDPKFIEEERRRIKKLRDLGSLNFNEKNSDLDISVYEKKGKYKAGDTLVLEIEANDNCYVYFLNFYGEGEVNFLKDTFLMKDTEYKLTSPTVYGGGEEKFVIFVCDKEINIDLALKEIYPLAIIENLKKQAKGKRYAIKTISYLIER